MDRGRFYTVVANHEEFRIFFIVEADTCWEAITRTSVQGVETTKIDHVRNTMKKMSIIIAAFLIVLTALACGGEESATQETSPSTTEQTTARAETNPVPAPTRPQRIENIREMAEAQNRQPTPETDAPEPAAEPRQPGGDPQAGEPQSEPATDPDSLIPAYAQFNDQVLLQDIYARMDLQEFALDPNEPTPFLDPHEKESDLKTENDLNMELRFQEARQNPYLHVFSMLEEALRLENAGSEDNYPYNRDRTGVTVHPNYNPATKRLQPFIPRDPVTYFLHHPWFEPVEALKTGTRTRNAPRLRATAREIESWDSGILFGTHTYNRKGLPHRDRSAWESRWEKYGPHRFGRNSTRGVLSEAVAQALEEAQLPAAKSQPLLWPQAWGAGLIWEEKDWELDDYLRTPIGPPGNTTRSSERRNFLTWNPANSKDGAVHLAFTYQGQPVHRMPWTRWELLHPKLPIVRVTSYNETILPLGYDQQGTGDQTPSRFIQPSDLTPTKFAASFVIAFQHRWESFQDPNRWLARFEEDYKTPPQGKSHITGLADPELHQEKFPNYWHSSDYMQHSIIGPVVVQVHESDVLEPGIYPVTPRVTEWQAPGPIAPDEHLTVELWGEYRTLPFTYDPNRPNANWPLPGHVMTTQLSEPGTPAWDEAGMDYWDW